MTDKQQLFCVFYVQSFNATKAYQAAYGCSYNTAMVEGCKHLRNPKIKAEINRLKNDNLTCEFLKKDDIFQKYIDIAFADLTEFAEFGTEEKLETIKDPATGEEKQVSRTVNFMRLKPSTEIDGTLLTEVRQSGNGISIRLADRMKALDWLAEHVDLATDMQRARIAQINAQTERLKQDSEPETVADDGFLDALNVTSANDWKDWSNEESFE